MMGHRVDMTTRDLGSGVVMTWIPVPANGTLSVPKTPILHSQAQFHGHAPVFLRPPPPPLPIPPDPFRPTHPQAFFGFQPPLRPPLLDPHRLSNPTRKLPRVPFPRFDGDNPRRWRTRAEKYFKMYFVEPSLWINISKMHFDGAASLWY